MSAFWREPGVCEGGPIPAPFLLGAHRSQVTAGKGSVAMADLQEASVTLPSEPASVTAARRYVCGVIADWGLPPGAPAVDTVRLIVSELATNAVLHTSGLSPTFTVDVRLERSEQLHIGVTDSHPRWPRQAAVCPQQQDNGRGMVIIRHLTAESGGSLRVTPTGDGGKTVWIVLPWAVPVG
jgi:anti-sigma regulatory factor (Ser/Thr protein kinase)